MLYVLLYTLGYLGLGVLACYIAGKALKADVELSGVIFWSIIWPVTSLVSLVVWINATKIFDKVIFKNEE